MQKLLAQIVLTLVTTILTEVILDRFYRKPKARLQLLNK